MRTREQVIWDFVQEWLRKADNDLRAARFLLEKDFEDYEASAFHAQQCAEKAIKAYLVRHQVEFPKTHDIRRLRKLVASIDRSFAEVLKEADLLTPYAVEFRYPGDLEPLDQDTSLDVINVAQKVNDMVREELAEYLRKGRPK